jgi:BolA protein
LDFFQSVARFSQHARTTAGSLLMANARLETIRSRLSEVLHPEVLELEDESHLHAGHAGAREGRGHYRVRIVSPAFQGMRPTARHQLVYGALGTLMQTDIHALSITALAPGELG